MVTFATEVAEDIRSAPQFWADLASLRASGIRMTLPEAAVAVDRSAPNVSDDALARLLTSAGVLAQADDEESRDLAQQIAVFSTLASHEQSVREVSINILAGLGNFPGLDRLDAPYAALPSVTTFLRRGLLQSINTVSIGGHERALTEFQFDLWERLKKAQSVAVSAPTSAGKSFLVLEHLSLHALEAKEFTAIYVAPTRALLSEIQSRLESRLSSQENVLRVTTVPVADPLGRPKQIYVVTQERLQLLLSSVSLHGVINLVVVDEAQAIGESSRGMILHDVLDKLRTTNPQARFLLLAPGAEGFDSVGSIVGLDDLVIEDTRLSPVVQNRISVNVAQRGENWLDLSLVTAKGSEPIGTYLFNRGFELSHEDARLAAVALELGSKGGSLVYSTGPSNAETLAQLLALDREERTDGKRAELAKFIEQHVHKMYSLAAYVRRGVAFHYGNMPSLLREGIEGAFKEGHLDYLCCTTTLFQGVNLPARNVFIDTPTRGNRGEALDEAALWNFAGRAGRLGKEVVGNVFLVGYDKWETKPLTTRRPFTLQVAFKEAVANEFESIVDVLDRTAANNQGSADKPSERALAAAGLCLYRASQGTLAPLLDRPTMGVAQDQKERLAVAADAALNALGLPQEVLATSWIVDPLALSSLLRRLREGVRKCEFDKLIPVNPSGDGYGVYNAIIRRMYKHLGAMQLTGDANASNRAYVNHVTAIALKWMRGEPLSQLVRETVSYRRKTVSTSKRRTEQAIVDRAIRDMFTLVEQTIRFRLVQWSKAYVDLLRFALNEVDRQDLASQIYDFPLALELGVSSKTGRALVELGLSRIASSSIAELVADSSMTTEQVRAWLRRQPETLLQLSGLILEELRSKNLFSEPRL